jgi:hypothetical protein
MRPRSELEGVKIFGAVSPTSRAARAVEMDFSSLDRVGGEAPRLEEPHGPESLVDAE